jgi:hypothetical protein
MDSNLKEFKQVLDSVVDAEGKCLHIMSGLLARENEQVHNAVIGRVSCLLEKFPYTAPNDILKELEGLQKNLT